MHRRLQDAGPHTCSLVSLGDLLYVGVVGVPAVFERDMERDCCDPACAGRGVYCVGDELRDSGSGMEPEASSGCCVAWLGEV